MDIRLINLEGELEDADPKKYIKKNSVDNLFSGSIDFENDGNAYVFNFVNGETLLYLLDRVKDSFDKVKIEIQTHARTSAQV
jgi:hypothetical protein